MEVSEAGRTRSARRAAREAAKALSVSVPVIGIAVATVWFAVLIGLCVAGGVWPAVAAVAVTGVLLARGWPTLFELPSPKGVIAVISAASVGAAVTAGVVRDAPLLRWVPVAVALGVIAAFAHQLLRTDGRGQLTRALVGTVSAVVLIGTGVPYVGLAVPADGPAVTTVTLLGVVIAVLAEEAARWARLRPYIVIAAILLSAGAGAALAGPLALTVPIGAAAGGLGALVSQSIRRVLEPLPGADMVRGSVAVAAVSVLAPGVVAYVLERILLS